MTHQLRNSMAILAVCAGLVGCASKTALKTDSSTAAIRTAEELGAPQVAQASLHLQLAKEELEAATALNEAGKKDEAASMLLRSEADAELAIALSRADAERTQAEAALERVRTLRAQNPYSTGGDK